ncbi:solute carrier family 49 member 4 homolog [Montipora foliosa]|uniref:solute carrier family 49 member 4 homolog n=1 Tax=Montipora foliosa TaxID=591990 RepID=UPI0035F13123
MLSMDTASDDSVLIVNDPEQSSLLTPTESTLQVSCKIYKRRWYVLTVYTAQAVIFNMTWNTWSPIQKPCKISFGWTDFDLLLLSSWAPIAYLVTSAPLTWLMDRKGLRISVLLTALLSVLGKGLQIIPFDDRKVQTIVIHLGQFLLMAGGPVAIGAPPLLSATWFPVDERTTATAIGALAGYFGTAIAFAVGPAMVPASNYDNSSDINLARTMNHKITLYSCIELGLCITVFLCILFYFPSRPPLPPSISSSRSPEVSTKASLEQLARDGQFWLLMFLAGLCCGVYFGWLSVLDIFLADFKVDAVTAGWLGCSSTIAGVFSGIVLARYADFVKNKTKQLLVLLLALSTISMLIFSLSCVSILPSTKPILYSSIIFGGFVCNGTLPLFFELAVERAYPVGEGIAGGILQTVANLITLLFYVAFMVPHSHVLWMNWVAVGGLGICTLGLIIYREKFTRLNLDICINSNTDRASNA